VHHSMVCRRIRRYAGVIGERVRSSPAPGKDRDGFVVGKGRVWILEETGNGAGAGRRDGGIRDEQRRASCHLSTGRWRWRLPRVSQRHSGRQPTSGTSDYINGTHSTELGDKSRRWDEALFWRLRIKWRSAHQIDDRASAGRRPEGSKRASPYWHSRSGRAADANYTTPDPECDLDYIRTMPVRCASSMRYQFVRLRRNQRRAGLQEVLGINP